MRRLLLFASLLAILAVEGCDTTESVHSSASGRGRIGMEIPF